MATRDVYFNDQKNELSFTFRKGENVCIGETDGTLQDFLNFMREDWKARNIPDDETILIDNDTETK